MPAPAGRRKAPRTIVHVGHGDRFYSAHDQPSAIGSLQMQARHQPIVPAEAELAHILHPVMQEISQSEEDEPVADAGNTGRHVCMMTDHQIDAVLLDRQVAEPADGI